MRLGRRLAAGLTPAEAAQATGVGEAEVETLLAEPAFARLVEAYRRLLDLPEEEQRSRLLLLARCVLEDALDGRDTRVAFWMLHEDRHGRDPARTLADSVIAAARPGAAAARPTASPAHAAPARRQSAPPVNPVRRAAWRIAARLRGAVVREHLARQGADEGATVSTPLPQPSPRPDAAAKDHPPPNVTDLTARLRARLRAGTAAVATTCPAFLRRRDQPRRACGP